MENTLTPGTRWNPEAAPGSSWGAMVKTPHGNYVEYADYAALRAQLATAQARIAKLEVDFSTIAKEPTDAK